MYGNERGPVLAETSHFVALGAVVEVDADVQPVANKTRPANAAVPHRTLRPIANGLPGGLTSGTAGALFAGN